MLSIDADEVVSDELRREILSKDLDTADGFYIPRKFIFYGRWLRWGGCYPNFQLRLFKKDSFSFDESLVHERVKKKGNMGYLKSSLLHYSYVSLEDYFERFNRYSSLDARERYFSGKRFHWYHWLYFPVFFIYRFFFRLGFLDGWRGFLWISLWSFYDFIKYAKLKELYNSKKT